MIYPGFWTQWTYGVAEFSDIPMEPPPDEDCKYGQFKAGYMTKYFDKYVDKPVGADGRSLRDRITFSTTVTGVTKKNGRWILSCTMLTDEDIILKKLSATRLIVANGLASIPNLPHLDRRHTGAKYCILLISAKLIYSLMRQFI